MLLSLMAENISPEERLFKVIQEGKKSTRKPPVWRMPGFGLPQLKQFFTGFLSKKAKIDKQALPGGTSIALPFSGLGHIDFKLVNKVLYAILAVITIIVIYWVMYQRPNLSKATSLIYTRAYPELKSKSTEVFKPLSFYAERAKKRDIFHPANTQIKASGGLRLQELIKDLSLAGIYQGEGQHFEAMIEDKLAKKTYFIKAGDDIKGMKVKDILKDRVILQYGDEELELL